ncbi:MAG: type II toxin-antitoxin system RelB/DinJ family antitoxin [Patescibacteria group bacterium]
MSRYQSYIQVRIEERTKKQAQKVLEDLGLDLTTAVKMLCKQIVHTGALPLELRDANGFTAQKAAELRLAQYEAMASAKTFKSAKHLLDDALA